MTLYEILGIQENATKEEVQRAYRAKAMHWHPDKNSDPEAARRFREIKEAYNTIYDESSRAAYDNDLKKERETDPFIARSIRVYIDRIQNELANTHFALKESREQNEKLKQEIMGLQNHQKEEEGHLYRVAEIAAKERARRKKAESALHPGGAMEAIKNISIVGMAVFITLFATDFGRVHEWVIKTAMGFAVTTVISGILSLLRGRKLQNIEE